jgi:hypothetical protein
MMSNSFLDRRKFLRWGAVGGVFAVAGCSGGDRNPSEVTTPPVAGGNRALLKKNADAAKAASEAAAKRKRK